MLATTMDGWADALFSLPAAWSVPFAQATMEFVSLMTHSRVPVHAGRFMVRLHTPEQVELDRG